jgi:hypothetical protein
LCPFAAFFSEPLDGLGADVCSTFGFFDHNAMI